jgi:hypothetical protein
MAPVLRFPARRVKTYAAWLLNSTASRDQLSKPHAWIDRPVPPEPLGNMLQRLARERPVLVLLLENIAAELLAQLER